MEKLTSKEEEVMELIWQLTNEARAEGKLAGTMSGKEEEGESQMGLCAPKDVSSLYPEPQPSANAIAQVFQMLEKKVTWLTSRRDVASSIGLSWTSRHTAEVGCRASSIASSATRT